MSLSAFVMSNTASFTDPGKERREEGQRVRETMVHSVRLHVQWKQRCGGAASTLSGRSSGEVIS
jgi:hypothetical protein